MGFSSCGILIAGRTCFWILIWYHVGPEEALCGQEVPYGECWTIEAIELITLEDHLIGEEYVVVV
jgi:hypothetical protein